MNEGLISNYAEICWGAGQQLLKHWLVALVKDTLECFSLISRQSLLCEYQQAQLYDLNATLSKPMSKLVNVFKNHFFQKSLSLCCWKFCWSSWKKVGEGGRREDEGLSISYPPLNGRPGEDF